MRVQETALDFAWRDPHLKLARGYTLIELIVVMLVLSILAAASFPLAELGVQRDRERELKRALWEIRDAIDAYKKAEDAGLIAKRPDSSGYPASLDALVQGGISPKGERIYFLRRVPRDPFADATVPAAQTWGVRSFYSPPDEPAPGSDVYDVYSLSNRVGLNGIALKDW